MQLSVVQSGRMNFHPMLSKHNSADFCCEKGSASANHFKIKIGNCRKKRLPMLNLDGISHFLVLSGTKSNCSSGYQLKIHRNFFQFRAFMLPKFYAKEHDGEVQFQNSSALELFFFQ